MTAPLLWNTMDAASSWLSEKTKTEWTTEKIIDCCINDLERHNAEYPREAFIRVVLPN